VAAKVRELVALRINRGPVNALRLAGDALLVGLDAPHQADHAADAVATEGATRVPAKRLALVEYATPREVGRAGRVLEGLCLAPDLLPQVRRGGRGLGRRLPTRVR